MDVKLFGTPVSSTLGTPLHKGKTERFSRVIYKIGKHLGGLGGGVFDRSSMQNTFRTLQILWAVLIPPKAISLFVWRRLRPRRGSRKVSAADKGCWGRSGVPGKVDARTSKRASDLWKTREGRFPSLRNERQLLALG